MTTNLRFMLVSNDTNIARYVSEVGGIDAFVDLEYMGKTERQGHLTTWKSKQQIEDVTRMRDALPHAYILVRVNPLHEASMKEINEVVARGANGVMLPMFYDLGSVARFCDMLGGRAEAVPLFETASAVAAIPDIVDAVGLRRLHIGMNDLHLDLKNDFLFEPLADGVLERPCAFLRSAGVEFGIGGIARAGEGSVPPDLLLGEHVRLGSSCAILSQTFHRNAQTLDELRASMDFGKEIARLRAIYCDFRSQDQEALEHNRLKVHDLIRKTAQSIRIRKAEK